MEKSQLLLVVGICVIVWVMLRARLRRGRMSTQVNYDLEHTKSAARACESNLTLANCPPETARLQVALYDLQRELLGELDTRAAAVRVLIEQADRKIAQLREFSGEQNPANSSLSDSSTISTR